jgi:selenocysteine-specific elongation factor
MPVIGTAGHVDHGKSTLIIALTGRDPDRLEEEKRRGLTIDLGFSWMTFPGGGEVSFVDVPGHDRFMKNMLAGAGGIDVGLLVVAADEGWKPQTEEHLAVLDLLGVDRSVVALTKIDRVGPEARDLVVLEIEERLLGTRLQSAPIVPVAAPTGEGLAELISALEKAVSRVESSTSSEPRLWLDRVFSVAGAGTVATGTLVEGSLNIGDEVALWPSRARSQVKGIQVHEQPRTSVSARWRVAVALGGLARSDVRRGEMIGSPRDVLPTNRLTASLRPARYEEALKERGSYHLHVGSAAIATKVRVLDTQRPEFVVLDLEAPVPLRVGDTFILRDAGRRLVVGGGRVLDPRPPRSRSAMLSGAFRMSEVLTDSPESMANALLEIRGRESVDVLRTDARGGHPSTGIEVKGFVVSSQLAAELVEQIRELTESHRVRYPLRPGIPIAELATQLEIPPGLVEKLVTMDPGLWVEGTVVTSGPVVDPTADERWNVAAPQFERSGVLPLSAAELGLDAELVSALVRNGHLVRIVDDWVYSPEQIDVLVGVLRRLDEPFTVAEFRDAGRISRKHAVTLLEWADRRGITIRVGDRRHLIEGSSGG